MGSLSPDQESHLHDWPNTPGFQTHDEQRTPIELKVIGEFPAATAGTLLRTGPSSYRTDKFQLSHWFDGFSQVYRFQITPQPSGNTKVLFSSRRQVDAQLERVRRTGRLDGITFAQKRDPCVGFFGKLMSIFTPRADKGPDAFNVAVTIHAPTGGVKAGAGGRGAGVVECRTDATQYKTLDFETLEPVGVTDQSKLHKELSGPLSSAHAQWDPDTGDCFNYNLAFGRFAAYRVFRTDARSGETEILATITGPDVPPTYVHSFFLTENHVVLCLWGAHILNNGLRVLWERNVLDAIAPFNPEGQSQWYVIDRKGGRGVVGRFTSAAIFAFHTINAWERRGEDGELEIMCDLDEYPSLDVLHRFYYDNLTSTSSGAKSYCGTERGENTKPAFARYRLPGIKSKGSWDKGDAIAKAEKVLQIPTPRIGELPTMNGRYKTREYRYMYGVTDRGKSSFVDGIVKTDLTTQESWLWSKDKHTPGEAIFIIDPDRKDREDGGWLLSAVLDGEKGTSYLLCLDAETMKEVARAECEQIVGFGFHGTHLSGI